MPTRCQYVSNVSATTSLADIIFNHVGNIRLFFSECTYEVLAGEKNGRKNRRKFLRSIFNVAHGAAPDCIALLPIRVNYVT